MKALGIILLIILLILFLLSGLLAQAPDTLWTKTYGGAQTDIGYSVLQTQDSGYIIVGSTASFGLNNPNVYIIKTDADGDTVWTRNYGGTGSDIGYEIQNTVDDGFIIAGITDSYGAGQNDFYLLKINANGDTLWTRTYGTANDDIAYSVQQTSDGGYILAGDTEIPGTPVQTDIYLVRTNSSGAPWWTKTYNHGAIGFDHCESVIHIEDSGFVIVGSTRAWGSNDQDAFVMKTDRVGDTIWTKTFGLGAYDLAHSITKARYGTYVISGYQSNNGRDVYLIKIYGNGSSQWTNIYGEPQTWEEGYSVCETTTDKGYVIAGYRKPWQSGYYNVYLMKTASSGSFHWETTFGWDHNAYGYCVKQTNDNGYIIAGSIARPNTDVYLIKTGVDPMQIHENPSDGTEVAKPQALFPNPFIHNLRIQGYRKVEIYDISGKFITEVTDHWNGKDSHGLPAPPGIYFLKADGKPVGKVVKIK